MTVYRHHARDGFTRASSLANIADFVEHRGGSIVRTFRQAQVPLDMLDHPATLIPLKDQFRILERAARETGDNYFGARLGQGVRIANLSAFGQRAVATGTLADAIGFAGANLHALLQTATILKLTYLGQQVAWSVEIVDRATEGRQHHEMLALWYMIDLVRTYAGRAWRPDFVVMTALTTGNAGGLEEIFAANVVVERERPAIVFDAALLSQTRTPTRRSDMQESRGRHEPPVPDETDFIGTVSAMTHLALHDGLPRVDLIAEQLGMARRSFQRRLGCHGVSFKDIVAKTMETHALNLLTGTNLPVTEIALRLGYQDTAHFSRAFKRWTGRSPRSVRLAPRR